jgi:hypothetical protein
MSYGRIRASGRTTARSFAIADDAAAQVKACLRKRASAPRRVGLLYRVRTVVRDEAWSQPDPDEQLAAWFVRPCDAP